MRCAACGFDIKGKGHGPYDKEYYVCDACWENSTLYFPDKKFFSGSYRFMSVLNSSEKTFIYSKALISIQEDSKELTQTQVSKYTLNITPDKRIEADLMDVPLDDLRLDPKNIRFRHFLRSLSEAEMIDFIWKEAEAKNLYRQIVFSQGLSEEPIVDSNFVVKEGNMRVVCLRKIKEKILSGEENIPLERIDPVRVVVLPKDVKEAEIAILLTRLHVTGKTEWDALNQAGQIYDLRMEYGYSFDDIAKSCGMGKSTVINTFDAYQVNLSYGSKYRENDPLWVQRYSYFYELMKKKKLKQWAEDPNNMDIFMQWILNKQIAKGAEVRLLPQIMENQSAFDATLNGAKVEEAIKILGKEDPAITSKSFKALKVAIKELQTFPRNELIDTIKNPAKMKMLETLYDELGTLIKDIKTVSEK